jgi:cytochrome oxidase Cu insertion factor (SCO1/SenC/PrrC family)
MRGKTAAVVLLALVSLFGFAAFSPTEAKVKVGDEAPDFELSDSTGRAYRLSDFRGKKPVVLEFFRSGDW